MKLSNNQKFVIQAVEKSWQDDSFKRQLIDNPVSALTNLSKGEFIFPEGKNIKFVDNSIIDFSQSDVSLIKEENGCVIVSIPSKSLSTDFELNEDQLEMVSGGFPILPLSITKQHLKNGLLKVASWL